MLNDLIKLANHLDSKGFCDEATYIDNILKVASKEELDEDEESEEGEPSKWHNLKMSEVVDEMSENDFNILSFEINDYRIRITKVEKND